MKPDYKNWMPKGMLISILAGAAAALVLFVLAVVGVMSESPLS